MKRGNSTKYFLSAFLAVVFMAVMPSCTEDDPKPAPFGHFSWDFSDADPLTVSFANHSNNAVSFQWAFGDGGTSTEENPTHTYSSFGTYTVTLTITSADGARDVDTNEVEIGDPDKELKLITGEVSKKWILKREGVALGIYSATGDKWWAFEGNALGDRPCILDDEITFYFDGTVEVDTKNTFWLDTEANGGWNDDLGEGCHDESEDGVWMAADGSDVSAFANGGNYTFSYDKGAKTITASGLGFYIGLAPKTNAGDNPKPVDTKVYNVVEVVDGEGVDEMQLEMLINNGDGGKWIFYLEHYEDFSQAPEVPVNAPPPPVEEKPVQANDLFDDFSGAENSSNITWLTEQVTGLTLGVDNPAAGETFKVAKYEKGSGSTENIQVTLDYIMDLSTRNQFSMKAFVPSSNDYTTEDAAPEGWASVTTLQKTVVLRFYDSTHPAPWETQAQVVHTVADADLDSWVDISYDFSDIAENTTYDVVIIQIGGEGHHMPGTFYIADFQLDQ